MPRTYTKINTRIMFKVVALSMYLTHRDRQATFLSPFCFSVHDIPNEKYGKQILQIKSELCCLV